MKLFDKTITIVFRALELLRRGGHLGGHPGQHGVSLHGPGGLLLHGVQQTRDQRRLLRRHLPDQHREDGGRGDQQRSVLAGAVRGVQRAGRPAEPPPLLLLPEDQRGHRDDRGGQSRHQGHLLLTPLTLASIPPPPRPRRPVPDCGKLSSLFSS